jgi:hypothetical protein
LQSYVEDSRVTPDNNVCYAVRGIADAIPRLQGMPSWFEQPPLLLLYLRLPLQLVLIAWALWVSAHTSGREHPLPLPA